MATLQRDFPPIGHYRMPGAGRDGVMRRRGRAIVRMLHHEDECVTVAAWPCSGGVRVRATAPSAAAAAFGVDRIRYALNLDHDLRPFHSAFKRDPLIGPAIRRFPWIRPSRIADPWQALAWAINEALIHLDRAFAIQRRLTFRYGRRSACGTLVDAPSPSDMAGRAPAELQACDL